MKITAKFLREKNACPEQVEKSQAVFPNGAAVTRKNLIQAAKATLRLNWLAKEILTASALNAYKAATAPAEAKYNAATASAWAKYNAAKASAWAKYNAAIAPAEA